MNEDPEHVRLRRLQKHRVDREAALADESLDDTERLVHERRAEQAAYLREQLERQADADREV